MKHTLILCSILWGLSAPVQAANQFVTCVQEQLNKAGLNAGPPDGIWGRKTEKALQRHINENSAAAPFPPIQKKFSLTWCRIITNLDTNLRQTQQFPNPFTLIVDEKLHPELKQTLSERAKVVIDWYTDTWNVRLASPPTIIVSNNTRQMHNLLNTFQRENDLPVFRMKTVAKLCPKNSPLSAFASGKMISLCLSQKDISWGDIPKNELVKLEYAIAHEYFHVIQNEFSLVAPVSKLMRRDSTPKSGLKPMWLTEGSAEYFSHVFMTEFHPTASLLEDRKKNTAKSDRTLQQIAREPRLTKPSDYETSLIAATLLAKRHGPESLIEYWEQIGFGNRYRLSFQMSYEMSLMDFEVLFRFLRTDEFHATAYAHRMDESSESIKSRFAQEIKDISFENSLSFETRPRLSFD